VALREAELTAFAVVAEATLAAIVALRSRVDAFRIFSMFQS